MFAMFGGETLVSSTSRVVLEANEHEVAQSVVAMAAVDVVDFEPVGRAAHGAPLTVAVDDLAA